MNFTNTSNEYGPVAKFFHWLVFLFVFLQVLVGYFMEDIPGKILQGVVINAHKLLGIIILIFIILRAIWALMNPKPSLPVGTPSWEYFAEHGMHFLLYFILLAMPLFGWIGSSAAGRYPRFGSYTLSLPVPQSKEIVEIAFFMHNNLAILLIILVSLHVCAALYHHFIRKNNILRRMWIY